MLQSHKRLSTENENFEFNKKRLKNFKAENTPDSSFDNNDILINGNQDNIKFILPARIIKRNFLKFKAKYLHDPDDKYKILKGSLFGKKLGKQSFNNNNHNSNNGNIKLINK